MKVKVTDIIEVEEGLSDKEIHERVIEYVKTWRDCWNEAEGV